MHEKLAKLNPVASRILNVLAFCGDHLLNSQRKTEKKMGLVGAKDRISYYHALKELEEAGFITVDRPDRRSMTVRLAAHPTPSFLSSAEGVHEGDTYPPRIASNYLLLYGEAQNGSTGQKEQNWYDPTIPETSEVEPYQCDRTIPVLVGFNPTSEVESHHQEVLVVGSNHTSSDELVGSNHTSSGKLVGLDHTSLEKPLIVRCRIADLLDDSGDIASRNSPAQKRRQAQVPLVQEAYSTYFPQDKYPLTEKMARQWLSWNSESAVDTVESMAETAHLKPDLKSPKAYLAARFKGEAEGAKAKPQNTAAFSSSAVVSVPTRPVRGAAAYVPGGELPEPTDEFLREADEGREFLRQYIEERGLLE